MQNFFFSRVIEIVVTDSKLAKVLLTHGHAQHSVSSAGMRKGLDFEQTSRVSQQGPPPNPSPRKIHRPAQAESRPSTTNLFVLSTGEEVRLPGADDQPSHCADVTSQRQLQLPTGQVPDLKIAKRVLSLQNFYHWIKNGAGNLRTPTNPP